MKFFFFFFADEDEWEGGRGRRGGVEDYFIHSLFFFFIFFLVSPFRLNDDAHVVRVVHSGGAASGAASMYVCNVVSKGIRRHITSEYTQQHCVWVQSP